MKPASRLNLMLLLLTVSECDSRTVVGETGRNVTLSCKYDIRNEGSRPVCWGRGNIPVSSCNHQLISTDGHKVIERTRVSSRYQLLGRLDEGDVSLTILNLTETDAGRYGCRVDIYGWFTDAKHHFDLTIERGYKTTTITGQRGSDVTPWRGSDTTSVSIVTQAEEMWSTSVQQVNSLHSFIGNTVRVSFIILIPALLLTAAYNRKLQQCMLGTWYGEQGKEEG